MTVLSEELFKCIAPNLVFMVCTSREYINLVPRTEQFLKEIIPDASSLVCACLHIRIRMRCMHLRKSPDILDIHT